MNYMNINPNDIVNGEGICVSLFVSGCNHRCPGCFNQEAWSFTSGRAFTKDSEKEIMEALTANNINRNFSILGGEPLDPRNRKEVSHLIPSLSVGIVRIVPRFDHLLVQAYSYVLND